MNICGQFETNFVITSFWCVIMDLEVILQAVPFTNKENQVPIALKVLQQIVMDSVPTIKIKKRFRQNHNIYDNKN